MDREMVKMTNGGEVCVVDWEESTRSDWLHHEDRVSPVDRKLEDYELDFYLDFSRDDCKVIL